MATAAPSHGAQKLDIGSSAFKDLLKVFKSQGFSMPLYVAFPILSAVFTYYLWVVMGFNGAADVLQVALASGKYADGTTLTTSYTGIWPLDKVITMIVAFEYPVSNAEDKPAWLMMLDIMSTLQTAMIWIFMDYMRKGRTSKWLAYPTLWCFAVNAIGAAVILPLYFWVQLQYRPVEHYIQLWDASPLPAAFLAAGILPGLVLVSGSIFPRSVATHQNIIACVQAAPLLFATIQTVWSSVYPIRSLDIRRRRTAALPSIQLALKTGAVFSALTHLVIVGHVLFGAASLSSIYVPDANATIAAPAANKILEGARYFLQWDLVGITLSTGLWCYYLVTEMSNIGGFSLAMRLAGSVILFGPGATTSAVLSWREQRGSELAEEKRQKRLT